MQTDSHELQVGEELGTRFRVTAFLGGGSFGEVYRMRDLQLDIDVAVKILRTVERSLPEARASFVNEARKQARLRHVPHVVLIYEAGELDYRGNPFPYIVMELLEGGNLRDRMDGEELAPVAEVCRFGAEIALALVAAAELNLVHRDIKPLNVLLDAHGHAKLSDFGLAKVSEHSQAMSSHVSGTMAYMAPEQFRAKDISPKTDIYALGCTLFHLLSGAPPHTGPLEQMMYAHLIEPTPSLRERRPDAPAELDDLLTRMMAKSPAHRPSASEIEPLLRRLAEAEPAQPARVRPATTALPPSDVRLGTAALPSADVVAAKPAAESLPVQEPLLPAGTPASQSMAPAANTTDFSTTQLPPRLTPDAASRDLTEEPRMESVSISIDDRQTRQFWGWMIAGLSLLLLAAIVVTSFAKRNHAVAHHSTDSGSIMATQNAEASGEATAVTDPSTLPATTAAQPGSVAAPTADPSVTPPPKDTKTTVGTPATEVAPVLRNDPLIPCPFIAPPAPYQNTVDGAKMILIPAGDFLMGSPDTDQSAVAAETPQRKVYLDAYCIYVNDVTVAQYRKFCAATGKQMPAMPEWGWQDDYPIVNVNWNDAKAYADWAGVSLPTEAQWEKAARGTDGRLFPWGNTWDTTKCCNSFWSSPGSAAPVGNFPAGASPYGMLDMAGNAFQWCADWYDANYYQHAPSRNPTGPATGTVRVLRGGSWRSTNTSFLRTAARSGVDPKMGYDSFGFRCARPAPGP